MNAETVTLTTFFESDPEDAAVPERYLAGFRDLSGKSWGVTVPLDAEEVHSWLRARSEHGRSRCTI